jgi:hypothetical protein
LHVPPGIGAKKVQESSQNSFGIIYIVCIVALEGAVMDVHIVPESINSSALEVACPPPGIEAKKVQDISETDLELLTLFPELLWNMVPWISTVNNPTSYKVLLAYIAPP